MVRMRRCKASETKERFEGCESAKTRTATVFSIAMQTLLATLVFNSNCCLKRKAPSFTVSTRTGNDKASNVSRMRDGRLTKVDSCDGSAVGRGVLDSLWRLVSRGLASLTLGDRQCEFRILRRFHIMCGYKQNSVSTINAAW